MAYPEVKAKLTSLVTGIVPDVDPTRRFSVLRGGVAAQDASAVSGSYRGFDLLPGAIARGSTAAGYGPKQLIQAMTLRVFYPTEKEADVRDATNADLEQILSVLEYVGNYAFSSTGLQNVEVGAASVQSRTGGLLLSVPLTVTYIGSH